MANKTAMQVLKSKIQDAISEINGELNLYSSGYKQCLINIQNDIDAQMMEMEKEQITDAHIAYVNKMNELGIKNKYATLQHHQ